ncbi:MAG: hypothetical protein WBV98_16005, partial [Candidatus Sulfotelmatobacter sp.]
QVTGVISAALPFVKPSPNSTGLNQVTPVTMRITKDQCSRVAPWCFDAAPYPPYDEECPHLPWCVTVPLPA